MGADEFRGPIHGRLQTLRGMCTDERPHVEIDAKLAELDDLVHRLSCAIEFPACKPTAAALERGRQPSWQEDRLREDVQRYEDDLRKLAAEHGWAAPPGAFNIASS